MLTDVSFIVGLYVAVRLFSMIFRSETNEEPVIVRRYIAPLALLVVIALLVSLGVTARDLVKHEQAAQQLFRTDGVPSPPP